jgi:hypothetical protein
MVIRKIRSINRIEEKRVIPLSIFMQLQGLKSVIIIADRGSVMVNSVDIPAFISHLLKTQFFRQYYLSCHESGNIE